MSLIGKLNFAQFLPGWRGSLSGREHDPQSCRGKSWTQRPDLQPEGWMVVTMGARVQSSSSISHHTTRTAGLSLGCPGLCLRPSPLYWLVYWAQMNLKLSVLHFPNCKINLVIFLPSQGFFNYFVYLKHFPLGGCCEGSKCWALLLVSTNRSLWDRDSTVSAFGVFWCEFFSPPLY